MNLLFREKKKGSYNDTIGHNMFLLQMDFFYVKIVDFLGTMQYLNEMNDILLCNFFFIMIIKKNSDDMETYR